MRSIKGFVFFDAELALGDEVRGWLTAHLPAYLRDKVTLHQELSRADYVRGNKIIAAKGCSAPHWPTERGGTGFRDAIREMAAALGNQLCSLLLAMVSSSNSCCKPKSTIYQ
jgi:alkylation response protein AidB-like acyl-CoA dehydrogenase